MGKNKGKIKRIKKNFKKNKKVILISIAVVALGVILLLTASLLLRGCSESEPASSEEENELMSDETAAQEAGDAIPEEIVETLSKNSYPEVNEIIAGYFTALQSGDGETLTLLRDNTEAKELLRMQLNGQYIEAYKNLDCYTKSGLSADSYVVFAYYEVKFVGHEELLPGITPLYVCRNEKGELYLHDLTIDDEISEYVSEIARQEDVAELYAQVGADYQDILAQNEALSAFVTEYTKKLKEAVGVALEEEEQSGTESSAEGEENENPSQNTEGSSGTGVPDSGRFRVGDTLNVRKSPSEDAERIGVCYKGDTIEILMKQEDGWTKVKFNGETGYIKSSVLK